MLPHLHPANFISITVHTFLERAPGKGETTLTKRKKVLCRVMSLGKCKGEAVLETDCYQELKSFSQVIWC